MEFLLAIIVLVEVLFLFLFFGKTLSVSMLPFNTESKLGSFRLRKFEQLPLLILDVPSIDQAIFRLNSFVALHKEEFPAVSDIKFCGSGSYGKKSIFMLDVLTHIDELKKVKVFDDVITFEVLDVEYLVYTNYFEMFNLDKKLQLMKDFASKNNLNLSDEYFVMNFGSGFTKVVEIYFKLN